MIRGPKNAVPTSRGWINPKTGELLKSQRITDAQIAEWHGVPEEPVQPEPVVEEPVVDDLDSMTKVELEELGREHGVELDRRKSKTKLVEQMRSIFSK